MAKQFIEKVGSQAVDKTRLRYNRSGAYFGTRAPEAQRERSIISGSRAADRVQVAVRFFEVKARVRSPRKRTFGTCAGTAASNGAVIFQLAGQITDLITSGPKARAVHAEIGKPHVKMQAPQIACRLP